jgi:16S rRNA (cytidine1402-2'-O)-methyltransferase
VDPSDLVAEVEARVDSGMRRSEAVAQVATDAGVSRRELYALVVKR